MLDEIAMQQVNAMRRLRRHKVQCILNARDTRRCVLSFQCDPDARSLIRKRQHPREPLNVLEDTSCKGRGQEFRWAHQGSTLPDRCVELDGSFATDSACQ